MCYHTETYSCPFPNVRYWGHWCKPFMLERELWQPIEWSWNARTSQIASNRTVETHGNGNSQDHHMVENIKLLRWDNFTCWQQSIQTWANTNCQEQLGICSTSQHWGSYLVSKIRDLHSPGYGCAPTTICVDLDAEETPGKVGSHFHKGPSLWTSESPHSNHFGARWSRPPLRCLFSTVEDILFGGSSYLSVPVSYEDPKGRRAHHRRKSPRRTPRWRACHPFPYAGFQSSNQGVGILH